MKKQFILIIALLALVSMMIAPVMAYNDSAQWDYAIDGGILYTGETIPEFSPDTVCANTFGGYNAAYPTPGQYNLYSQLGTDTYSQQSTQTSYCGKYWDGNPDPCFTVTAAMDTLWIFENIVCDGSTGWQTAVWFMWHASNSTPPSPVTSFTCTPTSQYPNIDVVCTDTSSNKPTSWLWTIDGFGVDGWQTSTSQNFNWQSAYTGVFSVNLQATNAGGSDWENKTNYVDISLTPSVTVTPTPTTTIPAGYVRNNLYVWDQNDAQISGADVDVLDVEAGTWTNTTADADGWITIDTLPYHTVNIYAHYPTANVYLPNEILGLETGYYGGHNWVIVLYPYTTTPAGYVTLYINTRDYDSKAVLVGVGIQIKNLATGAVTGESTGSTDSVTTVVTNATNYQITGSKSGYLSKTININSGEASSKTVVVELSKATVTPTVTGTVIPGEITVRPTVMPGCEAGSDTASCRAAQDRDMMGDVRGWLKILIPIAGICTLLYLIMGIGKK